MGKSVPTNFSIAQARAPRSALPSYITVVLIKIRQKIEEQKLVCRKSVSIRDGSRLKVRGHIRDLAQVPHIGIRIRVFVPLKVGSGSRLTLHSDLPLNDLIYPDNISIILPLYRKKKFLLGRNHEIP